MLILSLFVYFFLYYFSLSAIFSPSFYYFSLFLLFLSLSLSLSYFSPALCYFTLTVILSLFFFLFMIFVYLRLSLCYFSLSLGYYVLFVFVIFLSPSAIVGIQTPLGFSVELYHWAGWPNDWKKLPNFSKSSQNSCQAKNAKIYTTKLNFIVKYSTSNSSFWSLQTVFWNRLFSWKF